MQIPIELSPEQLSKAQKLAAQQGASLSTLIQRIIDRLPAPAETTPLRSGSKRTDTERLAAVRKVIAMTPEERRTYHAAVIAEVEEELREAQSASPQEVEEADRQLATFKQTMNAERKQRGAEPLFDDE